MINPKTLRNFAVYSVSFPTFAASPSVAKATVYMPSQVAARVFGGRPTMHPSIADQTAPARDNTESSQAA